MFPTSAFLSSAFFQASRFYPRSDLFPTSALLSSPFFQHSQPDPKGNPPGQNPPQFPLPPAPLPNPAHRPVWAINACRNFAADKTADEKRNTAQPAHTGASIAKDAELEDFFNSLVDDDEALFEPPSAPASGQSLFEIAGIADPPSPHWASDRDDDDGLGQIHKLPAPGSDSAKRKRPAANRTSSLRWEAYRKEVFQPCLDKWNRWESAQWEKRRGENLESRPPEHSGPELLRHLMEQCKNQKGVPATTGDPSILKFEVQLYPGDELDPDKSLVVWQSIHNESNLYPAPAENDENGKEKLLFKMRWVDSHTQQRAKRPRANDMSSQ